MDKQADSPMTNALKQFEATEANLAKALRLLSEASKLIPDGIVFGGNLDYDDRCRSLSELQRHLPAIDGWKPNLNMLSLEDIAQWRFDASEADMPEAHISLYREMDKPHRELEEYRFRFDRIRRTLVRDAIFDLVAAMDVCLLRLGNEVKENDSIKRFGEHIWEEARAIITEIDTLLGSADRPPGWHGLRRHARFAMVRDYQDIKENDWPFVKKALQKSLYGEDEALPVEVADLSELVASRPRGPVTTKLKWPNLNDEEFERLVFSLIGSTPGYENLTWLTQTRAPDRGRDLSVFRVVNDPLIGTTRNRMIIQCRHRQSSVTPTDVSLLRDQMAFWDEPRVDVLVIATSGRFTSDAVSLIEKSNTSDRALRIEMWPDSHLESLLAKKPGLIAEFSLR